MSKTTEAVAAVVGRTLAQVQKNGEAAIETVKSGAELVLAQMRAEAAEIKANLPKDGKDGRDGIDGKDGARGDVGPQGPAGERGEKGIDGKDGTNGRDGTDGLGFDDLALDFDGERQVTLKFTRGDKVKEFKLRFPNLIDRGVFKASTSYEMGDVVSYGGSMWVAKVDATTLTPGDNNDEWRLAVKRGRDGKQGEAGPAGPKGDADVVLVEGGH